MAYILRRLPGLLSAATYHVSLPGQQSRQHSISAIGAQKAAVGAKYLLGFAAAAVSGLFASQSESVAETARLGYLIPTRLARDVYTAVSIVAGVNAKPFCLYEMGMVFAGLMWH